MSAARSDHGGVVLCLTPEATVKRKKSRGEIRDDSPTPPPRPPGAPGRRALITSRRRRGRNAFLRARDRRRDDLRAGEYYGSGARGRCT